MDDDNVLPEEGQMLPQHAKFTHISAPLGDILKEITRRAELRPRLEAEMGRPISDVEFLDIAERTKLRI